MLDIWVRGAPSRARTCDLLIRSQTLYPTELRVHARDGATKRHQSTKVSANREEHDQGAGSPAADPAPAQWLFVALLTLEFLRTNRTMSWISGCDILSLNAAFLLRRGDHFRDMFVRVFDGVIGFQRWYFDLLVIDFDESAVALRAVASLAVLGVVGSSRRKFIY